MAKEEGGNRTGRTQGARNGQGGVTSEREGYTVYRGKEAWADELFATCRRLGLPPDRKGRPNLRALATRIRKQPYTLIARIGSAGDPELETLRLLEAHAGLPRVRSLMALGELSRAQLEAELGVSLPDLPSVESAAWAAIMAVIPVLPQEPLATLFAAILRLRGLDRAGNSHGPSPTAAERS